MRLTVLLIALITCFPAPAMSQQAPSGDDKQSAEGQVTMNRKFQVLVRNQPDTTTIVDINNQIEKQRNETKTKSAVWDALKLSFGTSLSQKTVSATTGVLGLLVDATKGKREEWLSAAQQQCTYTCDLSSQTTIDDFYLRPSSIGALDPANIKFSGIGCRCYLQNPSNPTEGREVFYVWCKLRTDEEGIAKMVNHSKFELQVDSFSFAPLYCALPNDSAKVHTKIDFRKRSNLTLKLNMKIYSSWINEAIMVTTDQLLGEFTLTARIDESRLSEANDSTFIYRKDNPADSALVQLTGDSFIVPRSFTGTSDGLTASRSWGTGQYRVVMTVTETCQINNEYYYKPDDDDQAGQAADGDGQQGEHKWDKKLWKPEWKSIKANRKRSDFWSNAWASIVSAYKGTSWVETFTDPLTTAISNAETEQLTDWLDIDTNTGGM